MRYDLSPIFSMYSVARIILHHWSSSSSYSSLISSVKWKAKNNNKADLEDILTLRETERNVVLKIKWESDQQ